jgi:glucose-1-phosphate adenylyltransferase
MPGQPGPRAGVDGRLYLQRQFLFEQLERDALTKGSSRDFGKDIIPHIVPRYRVFAHRFAESCVGSDHHKPYWRDVGTIDAYWEANMEMTKVTPELNLYDKDWPIWTYQEQLPPAKFVFDDDDRRGMAVDSLVSGGCIISGADRETLAALLQRRRSQLGAVEDSVILPGVDGRPPCGDSSAASSTRAAGFPKAWSSARTRKKTAGASSQPQGHHPGHRRNARPGRRAG